MFKETNMFEHEKLMENPMYKKGFQYCFDHYGVILEGQTADENIELHNSIREIKQLWKADNEKIELKLNKTKETLKAVRQSMYYHQKTSKDLRSKLKKTKDEFNSLRSKWYVRLFNLNSV
tara:strand:- start:3224 stop:3583 length:360 start_codon:yes stop_codon:yes gene_type:complete